MSRVLVTGASGFIGRQALGFLTAAGYEVHAVGLNPPAESLPGVIWHKLDLMDSVATRTLLERISATHLLHLAWYVSPGSYAMADENFAWVHASFELLKSFRRGGGKRAVMAGTCFEYDLSCGYMLERTTPRKPHTVYGSCKQALRIMAESYAANNDLSLAWAHIFYLYGPHERQQRLVASVLESLLKGQRALCTEGKQIRDFLHVEDAAGALTSLLTSEVQGPVNIGSGHPVSLKELVQMLARELKCESSVDFGALPMRADEPPFIVANTNRLTREVDWSPKFDLCSGLVDTVRWWRMQMENQNL